MQNHSGNSASDNSNPAVVGRLAPSPTGAQHVGNARTYLLAWLAARFYHGTIFLRMEDIDSPRVKPWAAEQAIQDIRWLGLDWDHAEPKKEYWIQTTRTEIYSKFLDQLKAQSQIYPCHCSRKDIQQAASAPHESADAVRYPDLCRNNPSATNSDKVFAWRYRTDDSERSFNDGIWGEQKCRVHSVLGDFVIAKSDGSFSYQLAATVDDHLLGVNQIVRGDDLIQSTFRQICLLENFEWNRPNYFHVPLVVGPDGRRLAKRHGDTRLSLLQQNGKSPDALIGTLAKSLGFTESQEPVSALKLLHYLQSNWDEFPWHVIPKKPFTLQPNVWNELLI